MAGKLQGVAKAQSQSTAIGTVSTPHIVTVHAKTSSRSISQGWGVLTLSAHQTMTFRIIGGYITVDAAAMPAP
jgi:hypothetical protein